MRTEHTPDAHALAITPQLPRIEAPLPRKRGLATGAYIAGIADQGSKRAMLYWVAEACREAREAADLGQAAIAANLGLRTGRRTAQSTIDRYEKHQNQPRDIDAMVEAYADELNLAMQRLWSRAFELWTAGENQSLSGNNETPAGMGRRGLR